MHALIIGASRGIGLALVNKYLAKGYQVTATCRTSTPELEKTAAKIISNIEVTSQKSMDLLASKVGQIDILIHCAGILISDKLNEFKIQDIEQQFKINALAPLLSISTLQKNIKGGGKIGLITSRMGSIADNSSGGQYGYRASKAALNAIGKSLANDLKAQNIAVFLLHPGYVRTQMTHGSGLIDPAESAEGLFHILNSKDINQTGTFWHTNGEPLPW